MTEASMNRRSSSVSLAFRLLSSASVSLAAMLAAQPALAQQAAEHVADNGIGEVGEIVVTAQKREERLQNVPISIAVLGGKALDEQPVGGSLDALAQVPGLSLTSSDIGGATSLSIRGVAPGNPFLTGSATVGYYLDSIPFASVKSAAVPDSNAYDMSQIEVLRGPQGTLYGASALNGVVRILTNDADPTQFEAKARVSTATTDGGSESYRVDAAVNIPIIADKLAVRVVAGDDHEGGWINQPIRGEKNVNESTSENLRVKLDAQPTENLKIDLAAWFSREHDDAASYADDAGNQNTPLPIPDDTRYDAYTGKISSDLPFMNITSATSFLKLQRTSYVDYTYLIPNAQFYSRLPGQVFSEELLLNSKGNGPWRWSAGVFYRDGHDDLYQTLPVILPGPISWRDSSRSYAIYGQITRTFADDHFEISAGGRYFHDRVGVKELDTPGGFLPLIGQLGEFHAVTPRFVATWLPSPKLTMYASYSQGFRSGFDQSPLALLAAPGLPPVQADKLDNYEVGAKGSLFDGFVTYDVAAYYITWDKVQQLGNIVYDGVVIGAGINGSSASGAGTDISLTLHPAPGFQVGGGFSDNGLKQDKAVVAPGGQILYPKGSRLDYSAGTTANAFANYSFALNDRFDARLNLTANYQSSQELRLLATPATLTFTSGTPLFVNANIEVANHHNQSVSIYVQNLTNWGGLLVPANDVTSEFRPRPRTIGIQFEGKF
jgi:iron complex outermembrane receptor protein